MITTTYDPDADAFYLLLVKAEIADTAEVAPGIMLDFAADGRVVGIEVTSVRARASTEFPALAAE